MAFLTPSGAAAIDWDAAVYNLLPQTELMLLGLNFAVMPGFIPALVAREAAVQTDLFQNIDMRRCTYAEQPDFSGFEMNWYSQINFNDSVFQSQTLDASRFPVIPEGATVSVCCAGIVRAVGNWGALPDENGNQVFLLGDNSLIQESVDNVLVTMASAPSNWGGVLILSGGANSSPSATGLAAKATLEGRGWYVEVNE